MASISAWMTVRPSKRRNKAISPWWTKTAPTAPMWQARDPSVMFCADSSLVTISRSTRSASRRSVASERAALGKERCPMWRRKDPREGNRCDGDRVYQ